MAYHTCPLCEATCGLTVTVAEGHVVGIRGAAADPLSRGYVCPKGVALGQLHDDPDRLRHPLVRVDGQLRRATWDEALGVVRARLRTVVAEHGAQAVAVYLGNPNVHNVASTYYVPALVRALGTSYRFSASTVDQFPQQVAAGLVFGTGLSVAVPDVDRTDLLVVLGANPLVSNGSMWTVPDLPARLRAMRARGGRLVVVDPVRTRTAAAADEHLRIRPGSDALWLAALARELATRPGGPDLGAAAGHVDPAELAALTAALDLFTPEAAAAVTGIDPATTRRIAADLAGAECAAVYARLGTATAGLATGPDTVAAFGTLTSWLVIVLNVLAGQLDRPGGLMWPLPAAGGPTTEGTPGRGRGIRIPGGRRTRVRGWPSALGEFPAAALAEEIDTPDPVTGERLRALLTIAGNPVVSTPDGARLEAALGELDLLVSVDAYRTETTRHADVVLPAPSPLARGHYDAVFAHLAVRDVARWSAPVLPLGPEERDEADTLLALTAIAAGAAALAAGGDPAAPDPTPDQIDDLVAATLARAAGRDEASRAHGLDPADLLAAVAPRRRVERLLDLSLRAGPYGDGFGRYPDGLTLARLEAVPEGVDLGPLRPRLPEVLRTPSGRIDLAPPVLLAELGRAAQVLASGRPTAGPDLVLVGRRHLRSNNSWLHNLPALAGGSNRCSLQVHPDDAARLGLRAGADAVVATTTGQVVVAVDVTDAVGPGVVSLPHGWGHLAADTWGAVARAAPGVRSNDLTPGDVLDPLSGTAVLNGIPVQVRPAAPA